MFKWSKTYRRKDSQEDFVSRLAILSIEAYTAYAQKYDIWEVHPHYIGMSKTK